MSLYGVFPMSKDIHTQVYESVSQRERNPPRITRDYIWSWECKDEKTIPLLAKITSENETDKNMYNLCPMKVTEYMWILCKRKVRDI